MLAGSVAGGGGGGGGAAGACKCEGLWSSSSWTASLEQCEKRGHLVEEATGHGGVRRKLKDNRRGAQRGWLAWGQSKKCSFLKTRTSERDGNYRRRWYLMQISRDGRLCMPLPLLGCKRQDGQGDYLHAREHERGVGYLVVHEGLWTPSPTRRFHSHPFPKDSFYPSQHSDRPVPSYSHRKYVNNGAIAYCKLHKLRA